MAIESQGTIVYWTTSTVFSTAQVVGGVTGFNGPSGSANVIDITNLQSTSKEKLMGLPDEGQISFDVNYDPTDVGQTALRDDRASRTKRRVGIQFTDTSTTVVQGEAYCTGFAISGAVDDKVPVSVTCELTGPLTWTTG